MCCAQQPLVIDLHAGSRVVVLLKYEDAQPMKQQRRILPTCTFLAKKCTVMAERTLKASRIEAYFQQQTVKQDTTNYNRRCSNEAETQRAAVKPSRLAWEALICSCRQE